MKKISNLFSITLIIMFVLPNVVSASWWNPATWFKTDQPTNSIVTQNSASTSSTETTEISTSSVRHANTVQDKKDKEISDLKKQISDLLGEINTFKNLKPEVKEVVKEVPVEKIVYQDKIVYRDREIPCQQETPADSPQTNEDTFSDFNFTYTINNTSAGDILIIPQTSRDLRLRKAVFKLSSNSNSSGMMTRTPVDGGWVQHNYTLEKTNDNTFSYVGPDLELKSGTQISGGGQSATFDLSNWIIWDNTVNKQVEIK